MLYDKSIIEKANQQDIIEVAEKLGMNLVRHGTVTMALCPWHDDQSPSLQIGGKDAYRSKCTCYVCKESHGVVDLVMAVEGCSFPKAMEWLCGKFGIRNEYELTTNRTQSCLHGLLRCEGRRPIGQYDNHTARHPERKSKDPTPTERAARAMLCSHKHCRVVTEEDRRSMAPAHDKAIHYCDIKEVQRHVAVKNALSMCLKDFFPSEVVERVAMDYLLGTDYATESKCHTLFPSIDAHGRVHNIKLQVYDINRKSPHFCHSTKVLWVGQRLLLKEDGTEYDRDTACLFGEHLLPQRPSAKVGLVESPKNAIVCACRWPDLVWVATGNKGMLKRSILAPLRGRQVLVYPDRDAHEEWKTALATMQDIATFHVSDALKNMEDPKGDIADYILKLTVKK